MNSRWSQVLVPILLIGFLFPQNSLAAQPSVSLTCGVGTIKLVCIEKAGDACAASRIFFQGQSGPPVRIFLVKEKFALNNRFDPGFHRKAFAHSVGCWEDRNRKYFSITYDVDRDGDCTVYSCTAGLLFVDQYGMVLSAKNLSIIHTHPVSGKTAYLSGK